MNQFIGMFLPSFIALRAYIYFSQKKLTTSNLIIDYFIFNTVINMIAYAITIYVFGNAIVYFTDIYTLKYLALAVVLAVFLAFTLSMLSCSLKIRIKDKE